MPAESTDSVDWDLLSSYAGLLSLALGAIYTGSFGSLKGPKKSKAEKEKSLADDEYDSDEEDIPDRLSSGDAYLFPILGSAVLFGLYIVMKYLGKEWINFILSWYFTVTGFGSVWKGSIALTRSVVGKEWWKEQDRYQLLFLKSSKEMASVSFRTPSLFLMPLSIIPSVVYCTVPGASKSPLLNNLLGLSFAYNALSILKIDSFKTGCIMLGGLFFYDIYWVFGTEVMVKVATSLDLPIKLLWPKSLVFSADRGNTMLGLGDIVVPGLFIALALRFDLHQSATRRPDRPFSKPYFNAAIIAYILGLIATMTVMHTFKAAQPALLYLSPACVLSFFVTAVVRGELKAAWAWADEAESSEKDKQAAPEAKPNSQSAKTAVDSPAPDTDPVSMNGTTNATDAPGQDTPEDEATDDQDAKGKKKKNKKKR